MSRKGKKRRQERRQRKQAPERSDSGQHEPAAASVEGVSPTSSGAEPRQKPTTKKRRARVRKAGHVRLGPLELPTRALLGWGFAGAAIAGVAVVAVLIATSGSSGVSAPRATAAPDPRVAGLTPTTTLQLEAGGSDVDAYFNPTTLTGPAGEAIEIEIENTGSLSHNLTIAGIDGQYDTSDDWVSEPVLIEPGGEGQLVVKLDDPGTYPFRCSLHPQVQFGELVLE